MEFDLIPQLIIIFSIGTIIFILGRNIPKIKEAQDDDLLFENKDKEKEKRKFLYLYNRLTRRINKDNYQNKMSLIWKWLEKSLRKIRIKFLKLDNKIVSVLEKLKKKHTEYKNGSLSDIAKKNSFTDESKSESKISEKASEEKINGEAKEKMEEKTKDSENKNKIKTEKEKSDKEKEYINLILKNPTDIKSYWKLGIIYSRRKKYKDSISCFRQIIKIDPGYTKAKKKISDLMKRMKKGK